MRSQLIFPLNDLTSQRNMLTEITSDLVDNQLVDSYALYLNGLDYSDAEAAAIEFAQIENSLLDALRERAGFFRHAQAMRMNGFSGRSGINTRFTVTEGNDKLRLLKDGSAVRWGDRPNDSYEGDDGKGNLGWPANIYISEVLPWLKSRQQDRILSDEEKEVFQMKPLTIATMNSKGGSEKTTETIHLAITATLLGFRCIILDGDPQATGSTLVGYPFSQHPVRNQHSLDAALTDLKEKQDSGDVDSFDLDHYTRPTIYDNLDIITGSTFGSTIDLRTLESPNIIDDLMAITKASGKYDLIFVDTRPQANFQDFAQYRAADIILNTLPANTTGMSSTAQGILNYLDDLRMMQPDLETRKHQISLIAPTCVESDNKHVSRRVFADLFEKGTTYSSPLNIIPTHIPHSPIMAEAASRMETLFQQTNINLPAGRTKHLIEAFLSQFESLFTMAILPHWLRADNATPVEPDLVMEYCQEITDPLYSTDGHWRFIDLGFAYAIEDTTVPTLLALNKRGSTENAPNPNRFLTAERLGLEGHQIIYVDGEFKALPFDLDNIKPLSPYVTRHNQK